MTSTVINPTTEPDENSGSLFFPTEVKIHKTRIDIINPSKDLINTISRPLSVYDTFSKWPRVLWRAIIERWEGKNQIISIPRYVPKKFITEFIQTVPKIVNDTIQDLPKIDYEFKGEPKNDLQRRVISYLFNERWELRKPVRILDLPVGQGKTFLSLFAAAKLGVKANIIVHKAPMVDTPWKKDIAQFTGIKEDEIFVIQGAESFNKALKNPDKYKIFITIHRTLENYLNSPNARENINDLYSKLGIGLNIIDEAHKEIFDSFLIAMHSNVPYTIYLTATLGRTNREDSRIFQYLLPISESFAANNYVVPNKFITYRPRPYKSSPDEKWIKTMANDTGVRMSRYCEYVSNDEESIQKLYNGITDAIKEIQEENPNSHIAILLGTLELVEKVYDALASDFDPGNIGNFTSRIPVKQRAKELEKNIILSTEKSMDSAIDCSVDSLIMCVPITTEVQITQIIGRIRYREEGRLYPVYDIVDTAFKKSEKNFSVRSRIIKNMIALKTEKI